MQVQITDGRGRSVEAFDDLTASQRELLARDAWSIGLRAVRTAYDQAQEARLADVGQTLVEDLGAQLKVHVETQEKAIASVLGRYFDADGGELARRLEDLIADGGKLPQMLEKHLGADHSTLAETLAKQVGETSPLFKKLSPTEHEGLVQLMGRKVHEVLEQEHKQFLRALDPLTEDSAVARFIKQLRQELRKADQDQHEQLATALKVLDANDPNSLMSQLKSEHRAAREQLLEAINPNGEKSPLGVLQRMLTETLEKHIASQATAAEAAREQQTRFEKDIRETVVRLEARRIEQQRSARGGAVFEDAVVELVQELVGAGYVVDNTSSTPGLRPHCKKGDATIGFPPDHGFHGAKVVVEAKRERGYTTGKALEEIDLARANRGAGVGMFVMARSHAVPGFPTFSRIGSNVLVVWDDEDPSSDVYLQGALMVALALATRRKTNIEDEDLQALEKVEQRVRTEIARLEKIRAAAEKIRSQVDTIENEVRVGHKKLGILVRDAKKTLAALNVELSEEDEERESPIEIDVDRLSSVELVTGTDG